MEVILRDDVDNLGRRGEIVKVSEGYGRNYLLPHGLALKVTQANRSLIERERKVWDVRLAKEKAESEALAVTLEGMRFVTPRKVGDSDQLYGSVTAGDIAEFLASKGIEIDKRKIVLDEPIKRLGDHEVKIRLHPEVAATLKILVSKEG